ncbi:hypothetical protein D3C75_260580 [compost metagenome]
MHPSAEEVGRIIPGLPLHILRQRNRHGTSVCLIGQHPHRIQQCGHQLLRPVDPVPVFAHRLEGIVHRNRQVVRMLHLLQHRIGLAGSKGIARQQQHRNLIGRCRCSCGQHIGRSRPDRGGTGHNLPSAALLGERGRRMNHALLIAALIDCQLTRRLLQRLSKSEHVTVSEHSEHALDEALRPAAKVHILLIQKFYQRLRRC